jgi:hypothetical protein
MPPDLRPRRLLQRETVNQPLVMAVDRPLSQGFRQAGLRPPPWPVKLRQRRLLVSLVMAKLWAKEKRPGLRLQLGAASQHRAQQPEQGSPVLSAQVKRQVMLPELSQARLLLAANPPSPRLRRASPRPPLLSAADSRAQAKLRAKEKQLGLRLRPGQALDFLLPLARARQCSRGPDPCGPSREGRVVRKCNRVVRCGDHPIFDRCQPPHKARALVDCDNRCSRSQRRRARRVRPFQIAALGKCPCLPRQIAG